MIKFPSFTVNGGLSTIAWSIKLVMWLKSVKWSAKALIKGSSNDNNWFFNSGTTFKELLIHFRSRALIFPKAIREDSLSRS